MTSDDKIQQLIENPPAVPLSRRDRVVYAVIGLASMIAVAGLTVAILVGLNGTSIAACINTNLGTRSAPSAADAKAHIAYAQAQAVAATAQAKTGSDLFLLLTSPKAEQAALYQTFLKDFAKSRIAAVTLAAADVTYENTLSADQADRVAHPLGKC